MLLPNALILHPGMDTQCSAVMICCPTRPPHMLRANKLAEEERKAKEKVEKEDNLCPLCGKDARFFCDCRNGT